jgi:hypothetical protein
MTRHLINDFVPPGPSRGPSAGSNLAVDFRVGARIARRSLRKHWVANLIVVLLIALPVAGIGALSTLFRTKLSGETIQFKPGEPRKGSLLAEWGAADFRLDSTAGPITAQQAGMWANLPKGSLIEPESFLLCGRLRSIAPTSSSTQPGGSKQTGRVSAQLHTSNLASPVFRGRGILTNGTWANRIDEIVISTRLAKSLKLAPGDRVLGCGHRYSVTGVVRSPAGGRYANEAFLFPAALPSDTFYVKLPKQSNAFGPLVGLNGKPFTGANGTANNQPTSTTQPPVIVITPAMFSQAAGRQNIENYVWVIRLLGAMALVVLGALAAAVFTVSAQRQRHTAGLLSLSGGSVRATRAMLLFQGTWCGLLSAGVGGLIGIVALRAIVPYRNDIFSTELNSYAVTPGDWLWSMAIAVVAATIAAIRPARTVAEGNLLRSERDRSIRPPRLPSAGKFLFAIAAAAGFGILTSGSNSDRVHIFPRSWAVPTALLAVVASVTAVWIGTPWLLRALSSFSSRFSAFRLTAQSLTRNLNRSVATMSAVGVVFGVLVAILLGTSASAQNSGNRTFGSGVALHRTGTVPCTFLNRPSTPVRVSPVLPTSVIPSVIPSAPLAPLAPLATIARATPILPTDTLRTPVSPLAGRMAPSKAPNEAAPIILEPPVPPTLSLPVPRDVVAPWELCATKGLTGGEVLQAQRIIGGTAAEIQTYQVNNSQAPVVTVANPELLNLLHLSKEERSILEREGIIDYSRFGADISVSRGSDGQLHNISALATPGLADLVREEAIRSASFTQVKAQRPFWYNIGYLVTKKALLNPDKLREKSIKTSFSYLRLERPLSGAQRDELQELLDIHDGQRSTRSDRFSPLITLPQPDDRYIVQRIRFIASGIAGAIALLLIALSLALSSVETRNDHQRSIAIGASPKTIRRLRSQSSALLAFGGCVIAVVVALPVFRMVLWAGDNRGDHVRHPIPFAILTLTMAGITAAAALLGLLFRPQK